MKNIFCHANNNDFSAQKHTLLKKLPNVICLKLNFEQKTPKNPQNRVFPTLIQWQMNLKDYGLIQCKVLSKLQTNFLSPLYFTSHAPCILSLKCKTSMNIYCLMCIAVLCHLSTRQKALIAVTEVIDASYHNAHSRSSDIGTVFSVYVSPAAADMLQ
jgi:hypothetical protein